jgi:hypothetical protein
MDSIASRLISAMRGARRNRGAPEFLDVEVVEIKLSILQIGAAGPFCSEAFTRRNN